MDVIDNMLDLTRRLPPNNIEENLAALIELQPDYADDLLGSIDQPLKVRTDTATGRDYLLCDYNRDGESYRSVDSAWVDHSGSFSFRGRILLADRHGRTNMTLLSRMERSLPRSCANWRSLRTRHLTPIGKCVYFFPSRQVYHSCRLIPPSLLAPRYYEGGVSSVFLWEQEDGGFAGVVLLKKSEYLSSRAVTS